MTLFSSVTYDLKNPTNLVSYINPTQLPLLSTTTSPSLPKKLNHRDITKLGSPKLSKMVSYEYFLGGVLVSLLGSIFFMIISSTLGGKKQFKASGVEKSNGYGNGEFLPEMEEEKSTDVLIVGAGVAGAALAYTLAKVRL